MRCLLLPSRRHLDTIADSQERAVKCMQATGLIDSSRLLFNLLFERSSNLCLNNPTDGEPL
jgi:hypothetical protein